MLLELKQPKAALLEYQKTIAKSRTGSARSRARPRRPPRRATRAASQTYYRQLLTICAKADTPGRPELQAARAAK
jgi:hypothetical protein